MVKKEWADVNHETPYFRLEREIKELQSRRDELAAALERSRTAVDTFLRSGGDPHDQEVRETEAEIIVGKANLEHMERKISQLEAEKAHIKPN